MCLVSTYTLPVAVKKKHVKTDTKLFFTALCYKYFVRDCLRKQIFGPNLAQPPCNSNFLAFFITPKHLYALQKKYKAIQSRSNSKFDGFVQALFFIFGLGQKFEFKKLSTLLIGIFLIQVTFLSQMSTFFRNMNHHWKCREEKFVIFWNFTIF